MSRGLTLCLALLAVGAGCSPKPEPASAVSPTAPSAVAGSLLGSSPVAPGGVSGPMDVAFPGRNDSFDFRNQLETKYQTGLGRSASATFVDREGEVVWTQEYIRYRVNGCDHGSAVQRVLAQIDGNAPGQVCGAPPDGAVAFPPRTDAFDFRRQLESKYQSMQRSLSPSFVDSEGGVIWTQEYLRYRVNSCDHTTSVQKVFSQIDGGGVAATCFVPPCAYAVSPTPQSVPSGGGTFTATVTRLSGTCSYFAESLGSFVTLTSGTSGSDTGTLGYTVAPNAGPARSTQIRVRWTNGSTLQEINQSGSTLNPSFLLFDPSTSTATTTTCLIRTASTPCQLVGSANLSAATATFAWTVTYNYPNQITHTQTSTSPNFTFTQTCGGPTSTAEGTAVPMTVTLTVSDANGTATTTSGLGSQPALTIKLFTC